MQKGVEEHKKREDTSLLSVKRRPVKKHSKASISTVESIKGRTTSMRTFSPFLRSKIEGLRDESSNMRNRRRKQFIRRTQRSFQTNYVQARFKTVLVTLMASSARKIQLNRLKQFAKSFLLSKRMDLLTNKKRPQTSLKNRGKANSLLIKEKNASRKLIESDKQLFWAGKAYHKMKRKKLKVEKVKGKLE